jgi:AraC-like DNA-binding protein
MSLLSRRHYTQHSLCHEHAYAQLVFGLRGSLQFEVNGYGSCVGAQDLAVVPAAMRHACQSPHGSECLVLDVPDSGWLEQRLGDRAAASLFFLDKPRSLQLSASQRGLVSWLAASALRDPLIGEHGAVLLLASLTCVHPDSARGKQLPLEQLDHYIEQHAAHPLSVADLARLTNLSVPHFHSRFFAQTGYTPMAYIRDRRLCLGQQLLCNSSLSVGEIAAQVGYSSQSAFTAALYRHCGETPQKMRKPRNK